MRRPLTVPGTIAVCIAACAVAVAWMSIGYALHQEQPDVGVYYFVSELGDALYGAHVDKPFMPEGGLPFTYTPFAAVLFRMMAALPFPLLTVVWAMANMCAVVAVAIGVTRPWGRGWQLAAAAASCFSTIMAAHIMMGQLNAILLLLIVFDVVPRLRPRWLRLLPVGVGVGVATAIKLTPVIVIAYLVLTRRYRAAAISLGTVIACFLLGWALLPSSTVDFFRQLPHLAGRVDVLGYANTFHNTGVSGILAQHDMPVSPLLVGAIVCAAGLALAVRIRTLGDGITVVWLSLVACLATPITWVHHWVALPVALILALRFARHLTTRLLVVGLLVSQIAGSVYVAYIDPPAAMGVITGFLTASPVVSALVVGITLHHHARIRSPGPRYAGNHAQHG